MYSSSTVAFGLAPKAGSRGLSYPLKFIGTVDWYIEPPKGKPPLIIDA